MNSNYWRVVDGRYLGAHYAGFDYSFSELAYLTNIASATLRKRALRGWSVEQAVSTKPCTTNKVARNAVTQEMIHARELSKVHSMKW